MRSFTPIAFEAMSFEGGRKDLTMDHEVGAKAPSMGGIKELQTRFLYPFYFEPEATSSLEESLLSTRLSSRAGKEFPVWAQEKPHDAYTDELLDHVQHFVFGNSWKSVSRYLKISAEAADVWFNGLKLGTSQQSVFLVSGPRIE